MEDVGSNPTISSFMLYKVKLKFSNLSFSEIVLNYTNHYYLSYFIRLLNFINLSNIFNFDDIKFKIDKSYYIRTKFRIQIFL